MVKAKKRAFAARQIRISNFAFQNFDETVKYIAFVNQQSLYAIKFVERIDDIIGRIVQHPLSYRECEQLPIKGKIYRQAVCLSWLVIYKVSDSEILILSIIHTSRSPAQLQQLRRLK